MKKALTFQGNLHPPTIYLSLILVFLNLTFPWILLSYARLSSLPGFSGHLPFSLETGYVGLGELDEDQLFYYFVESERNPREDPLVLWLTGGPGCSAWSGLVYEIGPLYFKTQQYNGSLPTLALNPYSWTKVASIIFLDAPLDTGFSYSKNPNYDGTGDIKTSKQIYQFLTKWLIEHAQFLTNPLYIGGDSYSGITVPIVTQEISEANKAGQEPLLNLKGYFVGNPVTYYSYYDKGSIIPYAHGMGIISDELFENAKIKCKGDFTTDSIEECTEAIQEANECLEGLNTAQILEPLCSFFAAADENGRSLQGRSLQETSTHKFFPVQRDPLINHREIISQAPLDPYCRRVYGYMLSHHWANDESVRKALGIHKGSINEWVRCNYSMNYTYDIANVVPYHLNLSTKGIYRALVYSGDHDATVPFLGTLAWIQSLNFSTIDDWRSWSVDGQVAGYTRSFANNMTFATIKGAGHTAPEYRPKEGFAMFQRWLSHQTL